MAGFLVSPLDGFTLSPDTISVRTLLTNVLASLGRPRAT